VHSLIIITIIIIISSIIIIIIMMVVLRSLFLELAVEPVGLLPTRRDVHLHLHVGMRKSVPRPSSLWSFAAIHARLFH
jgi:hypothetical protein